MQRFKKHTICIAVTVSYVLMYEYNIAKINIDKASKKNFLSKLRNHWDRNYYSPQPKRLKNT